MYHDPLTVLHPLLATEGHEETWSPEALTFHPFLIDPDHPAVTELRRQVLDLAFEELASGTCAGSSRRRDDRRGADRPAGRIRAGGHR